MPCFISHLLYLRNWSIAASHLAKRLNLISNGARYFYLEGDEKSHWVWPRGPHGPSVEEGSFVAKYWQLQLRKRSIGGPGERQRESSSRGTSP